MRNKSLKKLISVFLLLLFACQPFTAYAKADFNLVLVMTNMGKLVGVPNTHYLLAQSKENALWGIYTTDGARVCPYKFSGIASLSAPYFQISSSLDLSDSASLLQERETNRLAMAAIDGTVLTDYSYGYFKVYNEYWAVGWVLTPATEEEVAEKDYDYKADSTHLYKLTRCDVFNLNSEGGYSARLVASLSREEFKSAASHDKYLSIQNREKSVTVYDSDFAPQDLTVKKITDPIFKMDGFSIVCVPSGEIVASPFTSVKEAQTKAGLRLIATRDNFSGEKEYYLLNLQGEELTPPIKEEIVSATEDYAVIQKDGLKGLYSIREQKQLLPCQYDEILTNSKGIDPYLSAGYLHAQQGDTRYVIDAATGQIVYTTNYVKDRDSRTYTGVTYYLSRNGLHLFPMNKEQVLISGKLGSSRGSGYLFAMNLGNYYGVVDWNGNMVIGGRKYAFSITDDDHVIGRVSKYEYELYKIVPNQ